jgi:hypothetical protein
MIDGVDINMTRTVDIFALVWMNAIKHNMNNFTSPENVMVIKNE